MMMMMMMPGEDLFIRLRDGSFFFPFFLRSVGQTRIASGAAQAGEEIRAETKKRRRSKRLCF